MSIISFEEYKRRFQQLLGKNTFSDAEFKSEIQNLIFQAPINFHELSLRFIIRTTLLEPTEICTNISRCNYNPTVDKIPLQRCNYEKQQVFYASIPGGMKNFSDGAQPSLMETTFQRIKDDPLFNGRLIVATRWQIKKNPIVWVLPYHSDSIENNENFKFLFNQFKDFLKGNSETPELYKNFENKLVYLSSLFCESNDRKSLYKVSATFHNEVLNYFHQETKKSLNGLIYPSANTKGEGMNIVLTKEYVDKNLYCDKAVLYGLRRYTNDIKQISFPILAEAEPDKFGNLNFRPFIES